MVQSEIVISDDEEDEVVSASTIQASQSSWEDRFREEDYVDDDDFETWLSPSQRKPAPKLRNGPVVPPSICENTTRLPSLEIVRPGDTVELSSGEFLRIKGIIKNIVTDAITLRGLRLRPHAHARGVLPLDLNEVFIDVQADHDDNRPLTEQGMIDVPVEDAMRKRDLKMTNQEYPAQSEERAFDGVHAEAERDFPRDHAQLTCRWMHMTCYVDAIAREKGDRRRRHCERWVRLAKTDCDRGAGLLDKELKTQFRTKGDLRLLKAKSQRRNSNVQRPVANRLMLQTRVNVTDPRSQCVEATSRQLVDLTINKDAPSSAVASCNTGYKQGSGTPSHKRSHETSHSISAARVVPDLNQRTSTPEGKRKKPDTTSPPQLVDLTVKNEAPPKRVAERKSGYQQLYSTPSRKRWRDERDSTSAARGVPELCRRTSGATSKRRRPDQGRPRKLTVLDTFCGGGGVSRGAVMAGCKVVESFDQDEDACTTYRTNFPLDELWALPAHDFVKVMENSTYFVDIVHFSTPCPAYSRMNRTRYQDTDRNMQNKEAATCIEEILKLRRPRVATLEQTDGLLDFPQHFNHLLRMFIDQGYNVRWKVMRFEEYGLPQKRKRLVMIASCPGEVLPDFPKPTHSADHASTGLLPLVTIHDAISSIPPGWPNHDSQSAKRRDPTDPRYRPYSADSQSGTVCTGGARHHPSGTRDFTTRELACLQGFPLEHKFPGNKVTALKRQIGNAFPPIVVKALYEAIAKALNRADGVQ